MFENKSIIIATQHKKEEVIRPILEKEFGMICLTDDHLDTDQFGTFSGEGERTSDPLSTARLKCRLGMKNQQVNIGIASEGSFSKSNSFFGTTLNEEILVIIDAKTNIELVVREVFHESNYNFQTFYKMDGLLDFAKKAKFPSHGLILKIAGQAIAKGINEEIKLMALAEAALKTGKEITLETDMRAMFNPTRMKNIQKITLLLAQKMHSKCPKCHIPGFEIDQQISGLPCETCFFPTNSLIICVRRCKYCRTEEIIKYPESKRYESAQFCQHCNP